MSFGSPPNDRFTKAIADWQEDCRDVAAYLLETGQAHTPDAAYAASWPMVASTRKLMTEELGKVFRPRLLLTFQPEDR